MPSHFLIYELQSSDEHFLSQIMNFSLRLMSAEDGKIKEHLNGSVKLDRLQLPSPRAILQSRIDVVEHQKTAEYENEREATRDIYNFIDVCLNNYRGSVFLTSYSERQGFDLHLLRTSLIRNGFNPYYSSCRNLRYLDLKPYLIRRAMKGDIDVDPTYAPFAELSDACFELGVKSIEGILKYAQKFQVPPDRYTPYEGNDVVYHGGGEYFNQLSLTSQEKRPVVLIKEMNRQAYWIDLADYEEGKGLGAIRYCNKASTPFFLESKVASSESSRWMRLAKAAKREFANIDTKALFHTICDVEQHIYKISFDEIPSIHAAVWKGAEPNSRLSEDAKEVIRRRVLAYSPPSSGQSADLLAYAKYRYGGSCILAKRDLESGTDFMTKHPSASQYLEQIRPVMKSKEGEGLMESLKSFYKSSEICKVLSGGKAISYSLHT